MTKLSTYAILLVAAGFFLASVADLLGLVDWGFGWPEALGALGIATFAAILGILCQGWFALIGLGEEPAGSDGP